MRKLMEWDHDQEEKVKRGGDQEKQKIRVTVQDGELEPLF